MNMALQNAAKAINLPEQIVFKYSNKGKGQLREAVIIEEDPSFINYYVDEVRNKDYIRCEAHIEDPGRILRPPQNEPYIPYQFDTIEEPSQYLERAKRETIDSIYSKIRSFVKLFNAIDDTTITLLSANIIGSYFQDRLSTVHYLIIVGDNGTGKSVFGDTFELLGYRAVKITNATEAFWFRIFGTTEPGQVTIVAEELDKLDDHSQIMAMLKEGYQLNAKVPRMNNENDKMNFYYPFSFKILIAEKSPSEHKARGVLDRSILVKSYRGYPSKKIKEIRNPQGNSKRQKLFDEINDLRKLMLMFRLIHFNDPFKEVDVGLDGRDEELCKPLLQLFYSLNASQKILKEIEISLQYFIDIKNSRKQNSIEALICPIIMDYVSNVGKEISSTALWQLITDSLEGEVDEKNSSFFNSSDYGRIYRNSSIKMMCDKFGAEKKHRRGGNEIIFNMEHLAKMAKTYGRTNGIQTKLIVEVDMDNRCDSCDSCDPILELSSDSNSLLEIKSMDQKLCRNKAENSQLFHQNESRGSHESSLSINDMALRKVKCPTCDYVTEPFWMKIHQCPNISKELN